MGNVIEGEVKKMNEERGTMNVETSVGLFDIKCKHRHNKGEKVSLLVKQSGEGEKIKLKVEDVLFDRDQFQVKTSGGLVIHLKDAPKIGQIIHVRVKVECLA